MRRGGFNATTTDLAGEEFFSCIAIAFVDIWRNWLLVRQASYFIGTCIGGAPRGAEVIYPAQHGYAFGHVGMRTGYCVLWNSSI